MPTRSSYIGGVRISRAKYLVVLLLHRSIRVDALIMPHAPREIRSAIIISSPFVLSDSYLENDLVAIRLADSSNQQQQSPRLCVVRPDGSVLPLCRHEDDVETDLFSDPRSASDSVWQDVSDDQVTASYGEGWYGQRPVPSLGGGPGYGAEADETWSIDESVLEQLEQDGVELPVLDVGIAHGEKARGGALD